MKSEVNAPQMVGDEQVVAYVCINIQWIIAVPKITAKKVAIGLIILFIFVNIRFNGALLLVKKVQFFYYNNVNLFKEILHLYYII